MDGSSSCTIALIDQYFAISPSFMLSDTPKSSAQACETVQALPPAQPEQLQPSDRADLLLASRKDLYRTIVTGGRKFGA